MMGFPRRARQQMFRRSQGPFLFESRSDFKGTVSASVLSSPKTVGPASNNTVVSSTTTVTAAAAEIKVDQAPIPVTAFREAGKQLD